MTRNYSRIVALAGLFLATAQAAAEDITDLGGELSSNFRDRNAIQVTAPNVTDEQRRLTQLDGFSIFHQLLDREAGLGPRFNHNSCGGCHVNNGRGKTRFSESNLVGSSMIIKVGLKGLNVDGSPKNIPNVGEQLQDHSVSDRQKFHISLRWQLIPGRYPDGTKYTLRKPVLNFVIRRVPDRRIVRSLRMTPPVIGPGLLEAISDETILERSDPSDADGDGISGRPNIVNDVVNGGTAIGRFGFRASHPTVEQQSGAAALNDMGISNPVFTGAQGDSELSAEDFNRLVVYQEIAGVPKAINQTDPDVIAGQEIFKTIGCESCHRMTVTTSSDAEPELANQTIHPFTDLLLHNMGKGLADTRAEFTANGSEWRTTPLWGLGFSKTLSGVRANFLHDGRARTVEEAILWHGGEAAAAQKAFKNLPREDRIKLIKFLDSL